MKKLDDDSICMDMNNQIREMAGDWHSQMTTAANACALPYSRLAEQYAWTALGGNMVWAGASLLAFVTLPELDVAMVFLGAIMNFGGAMTGAVPGILSARGIGEHPLDSGVATLKSAICTDLDNAWSRLIEQSRMVRLTHKLLPVIHKRAHQARASGAPDQALDLDTAQEERRKLLWACMFPSVFRYNDFAGIRKVATNAMSDMYNIAVKYFDEYTQFVDQQAEQSMPQEYRWGKPGETMAMKQMWMDKTRGEMLTSAAFLNRLRASPDFRRFVQRPEMNQWYKCTSN